MFDKGAFKAKTKWKVKDVAIKFHCSGSNCASTSSNGWSLCLQLLVMLVFIVILFALVHKYFSCSLWPSFLDIMHIFFVLVLTSYSCLIALEFSFSSFITLTLALTSKLSFSSSLILRQPWLRFFVVLYLFSKLPQLELESSKYLGVHLSTSIR